MAYNNIFVFEIGDVVKIEPQYLDDGEDPNVEYIVREDHGDGHIDVFLPKQGDTLAAKGIWTWPSYTMRKVGHKNLMPDGVEVYDAGDVLANDKTTVWITAYDDIHRLYHVMKTGKDSGEIATKTRLELALEGFERV